MRFNQVDPHTFIDTEHKKPAYGRGAWTKTGKANGSWRYEYINGMPQIGTNAQVSLDAWATCIGCYNYQRILTQLGFMEPLPAKAKGVFGPATREAVLTFQAQAFDVSNPNRPLDTDGTIGTTDARAMITPIIDAAERKNGIPNRYLRGETSLESGLDLGALGYYIYYGAAKSYRGVDRGISQINSEAHPDIDWNKAFNPYYCIDWSAQRMRSYYDSYKRNYPNTPTEVLWDAALCAHNNPSAAGSWAKNGVAPTEAAASYVNNCKAARY